MTTTDTRHPREREADMLLWERLFGGASPAVHVAACPKSWSADDIAADAWAFFTGPNIPADERWDDLDRDATIDSLARTLRYEGGAR